MAYSTPLDVVILSGLADLKVNVLVGTGDNTEDTFNMPNKKIVASSYIIYLDGVEVEETTDYSLDVDTGKLVFVAPPGDEVVITATYRYFDAKLPFKNSDVAEFIASADNEITQFSGGKTWEAAAEFTEYFDGQEKPYMLSHPEQYAPDFVVLKHTPVDSITSAEFLDEQGNTVVDISVTPGDGELKFESWGKVIFLAHTIPNGTQNVKIVYEAGADSVPQHVKDLSCRLAALRMASLILNASYNDATSFSMEGQSVTVGEVYVNAGKMIDEWKKEIENLWKIVGKRQDIVVI